MLGNDITAPVAISELKRRLYRSIRQGQIAIVLDHYTPCKDIKAAQLCACGAQICQALFGYSFLRCGGDGGRAPLIPKKGLAAPGEIIIGADSHTEPTGRWAPFQPASGSTDMAAGMATGCSGSRASAIKVSLKGRLNPYVSGKDVILH